MIAACRADLASVAEAAGKSSRLKTQSKMEAKTLARVPQIKPRDAVANVTVANQMVLATPDHAPYFQKFCQRKAENC